MGEFQIARRLLPLALRGLLDLSQAEKDCGIKAVARDSTGYELRVDDFHHVELVDHGRVVTRWGVADFGDFGFSQPA